MKYLNNCYNKQWYLEYRGTENHMKDSGWIAAVQGADAQQLSNVGKKEERKLRIELIEDGEKKKESHLSLWKNLGSNMNKISNSFCATYSICMTCTINDFKFQFMRKLGRAIHKLYMTSKCFSNLKPLFDLHIYKVDNGSFPLLMMPLHMGNFSVMELGTTGLLLGLHVVIFLQLMSVKSCGNSWNGN